MAQGMKHKYYIDAHKGLTPLVVLVMMAIYGAWNSTQAWLYFAVHGSYGILWVTKSYTFPDSQWEKPVTPWYGLYTFFGLGLYWVTPWLMISGRTATPPPWLLGIAVFVYAIGLFWHYASDMQKYVSLSLRPGVLITGVLWHRLRNPNYLGELLIYASFGLVAFHYWTFVVLGSSMVLEWIPNMRKKERSLARYPEFPEWKRRSWCFLPGIW